MVLKPTDFEGTAAGGCGWSWKEVHGLRQLHIVAGNLFLAIIPDKGFDIDGIVHRPSGSSILSRHTAAAARLQGFAAHGKGSTDYIPWFQGGWQDLIPSRLALDGVERRDFHTAALESWDILDIKSEGGRVQVTAGLHLPDSGLSVCRRLIVDGDCSSIRLEECAENQSDRIVEFTWTQHLTFGGDLLGPGTFLGFPRCSVLYSPEMPSGSVAAESSPCPVSRTESLPLDMLLPDEGSRFFALGEFAEAGIVLFNPETALRVELLWDLEAMPHLWVWAANTQEIRALGLEPSTTAYPDLDAARNSDMVWFLEPGGSRTSWLELNLKEDDHDLG